MVISGAAQQAISFILILRYAVGGTESDLPWRCECAGLRSVLREIRRARTVRGVLLAKRLALMPRSGIVHASEHKLLTTNSASKIFITPTRRKPSQRHSGVPNILSHTKTHLLVGFPPAAAYDAHHDCFPKSQFSIIFHRRDEAGVGFSGPQRDILASGQRPAPATVIELGRSDIGSLFTIREFLTTDRFRSRCYPRAPRVHLSWRPGGLRPLRRDCAVCWEGYHCW